jgi:hypothetical protein
VQRRERRARQGLGGEGGAAAVEERGGGDAEVVERRGERVGQGHARGGGYVSSVDGEVAQGGHACDGGGERLCEAAPNVEVEGVEGGELRQDVCERKRNIAIAAGGFGRRKQIEGYAKAREREGLQCDALERLNGLDSFGVACCLDINYCWSSSSLLQLTGSSFVLAND